MTKSLLKNDLPLLLVNPKPQSAGQNVQHDH
jgi:hypothetical protein